ncbi:MAG TPA: hypothetical protein VE861_07640 [Gemmatimonadaceae bacterium]|nr:hypothetical protein [Gemmatimonadaceae bacterium]
MAEVVTQSTAGIECIAIDWSGAVTGAASRIWLASARDGVLTQLDAPGSRDSVRETLLARRQLDEPVLAGLDFAFGLPAWYAAERGWRDIDAVWRAVCDEGESWLRLCAPPFWGRPGTRRPHDAALGHRECERRHANGVQPKSVFQVGGAGSVGTGSIRGMPMLTVLRTAGWAVWPFDAAASHTVVEIWPRLFTGAVVKSSAAAREAWLARHHPAVVPEFRAIMVRSEDAFDAGLSAIGMSEMSLAEALAVPRDPLTMIEGAICAPAATDGR